MAKKFQPELFIDIGKLGCFHTLRETYLHTTYIRGEGDMGGSVLNGVYQGTVITEVRSFHHFNLSTDAHEAFAKAQEAAERLGLPLANKSAEELVQRLNEIHRATEEELERRAREAAELRAKWDAERAAKNAKARALLDEGLLAFGRKVHDDKDGNPVPIPFAELDNDYLAWVVSKEDDFEADSLMRAFAVAIRTKFAHLLPRVPDPDLHVGEVGERRTFEVEVLSVRWFDRPKFGADWLTESVAIVTMITPEGACLVSKGTSFHPAKGSKLTIKATVKEHSEYRGQAQTIVQRIADAAAPKKARKTQAQIMEEAQHEDADRPF